MKWLKLIRIHHYIKNVLVFFPLFFNGSIFNIQLLITSFMGFLVFGLISSIVYIINDLHDVDKDKLHPIKSKRPIASGEINPKQAKFVLLFLLFVVCCIHILFFQILASLKWLVLYLILNIMYSYGLKNKPIIDIAILVSGFLIRVLYGADITGITLSNWLILTVMSVSFYLALGKRRNEYQDHGNKTRAVLKYYNYEFLDKNMTVSLALSDIFYSLWCMNMIEQKIYSSTLVWTIPIILLIQMKYSLDIEGSSDGDPVEVLFHDKLLIGMVALYVIILVVILY